MVDPDDLTEEQLDALLEFADECNEITASAIIRLLTWFWWPWF